MPINDLLFHLTFFLIVISSLLVILSENAVYSVLFLILTFCNVVFLLLLIGAEFFSFLLLIVYIGAIAVLFLFVVMMLNLKKSDFFKFNNLFYFLPLILLSSLFFIDLFKSISIFFDVLKNVEITLTFTNWLLELNSQSNIQAIGNVLYTDFCLLFVISSLILLISMIGVIVLTIHQKTNYIAKKQIINNQLIRDSKSIVKFTSHSPHFNKFI